MAKGSALLVLFFMGRCNGTHAYMHYPTFRS